MSYLSVDGNRLYYEDSGSGHPVLFLHGLGSSTRDWFEQIPCFEKQYRVLRLDLRGHGRSDRPQGPYHMAAFARDVAVLLRKLDAGPAHVVGLSMGGMVALQLAVDAPQLVRRLVVVNSAADLRLKTWEDVWFYVSRRAAVQTLGMRRVGRLIANRLFVKPNQDELRQEFIKRWAENDKQGYLWSLDAIMGWSVADQLSSVSIPTLFMSSDDDYTPVSEKNRMAAAMPEAELVVIEDARHALPVERPAVFNTILKDFLGRSPERQQLGEPRRVPDASLMAGARSGASH